MDGHRRESRNPLVGIGLYTPAEAGRLVRVAPRKITRWLRGHTIGSRFYEPLWRPAIDLNDEGVYLDFRDLMEVRIAAAFIARGVPAIHVRKAIEEARSLIQIDRPLSTARFRTDGRTIFLEMAEEDGSGALLDLVKRQHVFREIIEQSLKGIDYDAFGIPERWWPLGRGKSIVVDPRRSFGKPIEAETSVPAEAMAAAAAAEGSAEAAARIWDVPLRAVRRALEFEAALETPADA